MSDLNSAIERALGKKRRVALKPRTRVSAAFKRKWNSDLAELDRLVDDCKHEETRVVTYSYTDNNGLALEGGAEERCAFVLCNKLMRTIG